MRRRVIVDHADQKRAPEGEPARLRVGREAELADDRVDLKARLFLHERRIVDHARHGLLRHVGQARDVVDRRSLAAAVGIGSRRMHVRRFMPRWLLC